MTDDFEDKPAPVKKSDAEATRPRVPLEEIERRRDQGSGFGGESGGFDAPNATIRIAIDTAKHRPSRKIGSLLVVAGTPADIGKHFLIEDDATVLGRSPEGLHLRDGNISRRHAKIERQGADYYVCDLGSTNGTVVNGKGVREPAKLADGDTIVLGQTVVKFHMVDETEASYHHQVQKMVTTDETTGLAIKRHFDAVFKQAVEDALASGAALCALMLELDAIKPIVERHGHIVGEAVIRDVAGIIKRLIVPHGGEACSLGGGQYVAYVPGVELPTALTLAEEIRRDVERGPLAVGMARVATSVTIGVARLPPMAPDAQALLRLADAALFRARSKGRNRVSD